MVTATPRPAAGRLALSWARKCGTDVPEPGGHVLVRRELQLYQIAARGVRALSRSDVAGWLADVSAAACQ